MFRPIRDERNEEQQARWILGQYPRLAPPGRKGGVVGVFPAGRISRRRTCWRSAPDSPVSTFVGAAGGTAKAPIHRYRFPPQETELRGGEELRNLGGAKLGKVEAISFEDRHR